ncbi:iron-containing alcohol dehydrogenase [Clostridium grantii]|uniref:Alcohol dehydrogenase n=1 Tax=Clostridium grantii DSM 8605 TaxID=1121316 RepID=A0A1M5XD76_9CLOT|nr:iron-containing alcohol dehydrogenase [Clostridium grantii]SHH97508.1 alcohol dehydrogenase [Clostridium grantii DSM 8605]
MLESRRMYLPALALLGPGCVKEIGAEIKKMGLKKALVVTDKVLLEIGVVDKALESLVQNEIDYTVYSNVKPNPTIANVNEGFELLKANSCDFLLSIGGGSPQDCAKAISILATNPGDIKEYEGVNKTANKGLPIIAVNTTAGTASEATINYVITDEQRKVKMVIVDSNSLATIAVNDPELMIKMPKALTAATGMDALTHAIEGYTTKGASILTDTLNLEAIKIISSSLREAVNNGENLEARSKMAYGQYMTGMAFSNCGLGIVHSMAHQLGGTYDLPHGVCNAILLPYIVEYNAATIGDKLKNIAIAMGENVEGLSIEEANKIAISAIKKLSEDVGIPSGLAELGVNEEKLSHMADLAMIDACTPGNPKNPTKEDMVSIYKKAL